MNKILLKTNIGEYNKKMMIKRFEKQISCTNNYELIFMTTAITRPNLHKISFSNYAKYIPKDISILWIINVDYVKFAENENKMEIINRTIDNIKSFFTKHNIEFKFKYSLNGNFNKAIRTVVNETLINISNSIKYIINLEDDWYIENEINFKKLISKSYDIYRLNRKDKNYCQNCISFQPILLKPFVWYMVFYESLKKNKDISIDPEKICQKGEPFIKKFNLSYQADFYFKDIGRNYLNNNSDLIRGWFQKENEINLSLSYIDTNILIKSLTYKFKIKNTKANKQFYQKIILNKLSTLFRESLLVIVQNKFLENLENNYDYYLNLKVDPKINNIQDIYTLISNQIESSNLTGA